MVARRHVVRRWLRYLFNHSHSRLYPSESEAQAIAPNEHGNSEIKCGELFIVDGDHKESENARRQIYVGPAASYTDAHKDAPWTDNGRGKTSSGVMPMINAGVDPDEILVHAARNVHKSIIVTGEAVCEWGKERECLLLAGAHPDLFPNARGIQEDINISSYQISRIASYLTKVTETGPATCPLYST